MPPLFWQTWWFRLLAVGLVLGALYAAHRYRVERLLEMERMRSRIAADLHDDIGSNLSSIALLSEMLQGRLRPDGSSLEEQRGSETNELEQRQLLRIERAAEETVSALKDVIWLVDPKHDNLADLTRKMRRVAGELLGGTAYTFGVPDPFPSRRLDMTFLRNTFLIYKEALHNIAKHARAEHVAIEVAIDQGVLVLRIRDDGTGFRMGEAQGRGHGLKNMRQRAEQAGGRIEIESMPGRGTQITFSARMA